MARTKSRRTQGQQSGSRTSGSVPDIFTVGRFLLRPEIVGTAIVVMAAAWFPTLLPLAGVLDDARDSLVWLLGLHAFTLVLIVATGGVVLALRRGAGLGRHRRHMLGAATILVLVAGLFGRWYPQAEVGTIDLATHSAGGDIGRRLTADFATAAVWLLTIPAAFALLWPRTAAHILRSMPGTLWRGVAALAVGFWRLGMHRHAARAISAPFRRKAAAPSIAAAPPANAPGAADTMHELAGPPEPSLAAAIPFDPAVLEAPDEPVPPPPEEDDEEDSGTQIPMDMETPAESWRHSSDGWQLPPVDLLQEGSQTSSGTLDSDSRARAIEETLASFGVNATVTQINEGPAVTQFGIEPGWDIRTRLITERDASGKAVVDEDGQPRMKQVETSRTKVRVNRITALQNDLALALAAPSLRIEAPVPGKQMLGIEVPNLTKTTVALRSVLESTAYRKASKRAALPIPLGAGVSGESAVGDLGKMPHLLIAGATGSGKSVCLNAIITGLLMNYSPEQLRFVMIDPKRVELTAFTDIPHLAFSEIVVDIDKIRGALQAVLNEMESRYRRFAQVGVRDIHRYNEQVASKPLPYWVVVVDELADVMLANPYQVERQIVRLASQVDSRTVLDQAGAEKLLGQGDMLFLATDSQKPRRLQGVYVSDAETEVIVEFWTGDRFVDLEPEKHDDLLREGERQVEEMEDPAEQSDDEDPIFQKALTLARETNRISTSMLQRKLRIGYPRAARIMDELEERGFIGPAESGGSSRQVMMEPEPAAAAGGAASVWDDDGPAAPLP
jgi:S-DNA-T family DNA segregation ATPase FtsK/SpoIIIE